MEKGNLKIEVKTVVHCPTRELAKEVLKIADSLGYKWNTGKLFTHDDKWQENEEDTCYNLYEGKFSWVGHYVSDEYAIISARDFINLHNTGKRIYIRGDNNRGSEIIKHLESLGGVNVFNYIGIGRKVLYYIGEGNRIERAYNENERWLLEQLFTEYKLPEIVEVIEIGGIKYRKDEFEKAVKNLKPIA